MLQPDMNDVIGSLAWKIIGILGAAIAAMGGYIVGMHAKHSAKVEEMYKARLEDLKDSHRLIDTLMEAVRTKTKGGPS